MDEDDLELLGNDPKWMELAKKTPGYSEQRQNFKQQYDQTKKELAELRKKIALESQQQTGLHSATATQKPSKPVFDSKTNLSYFSSNFGSRKAEVDDLFKLTPEQTHRYIQHRMPYAKKVLNESDLTMLERSSRKPTPSSSNVIPSTSDKGVIAMNISSTSTKTSTTLIAPASTTPTSTAPALSSPSPTPAPPVESFFSVVIRVDPVGNSTQNNNPIELVVDENTISFSSTKNSSDDNKDGEKKFIFEKVYGQESTNKEIYENHVLPGISDALEGYGSAVTFYGNSKIGDSILIGSVFDGEDNGVLLRSLKELFSRLNSGKEGKSLNSQSLVFISFLEVHNEKVYDLFGQKEKTVVQVAHDHKYGFIVPRATKYIATSAQEAITLILKGESQRETQLGKGHIIISITIEQSSTNVYSKHTVFTVGRLDFISLGDEQENQELLNSFPEINRSISRFNSLIITLTGSTSETLKNRIGVYGGSKVTQLLWQVMGGDSKTVIIGCVSPQLSALKKTLHTLGYCHKAKKIVNHPNKISRLPPCTMMIIKQENYRIGILLKQYTELQFAIMKAIREVSSGGESDTMKSSFSIDLLNKLYFLDLPEQKSIDQEGVEEKNDALTILEKSIRTLESSATNLNIGSELSDIRMPKQKKSNTRFHQLGLDVLLRDLSGLKSRLIETHKRDSSQTEMEEEARAAEIEEQIKIIQQLREENANLEASISEQDASLKKLETKVYEEVEAKQSIEEKQRVLLQDHKQLLKTLGEAQLLVQVNEKKCPLFVRQKTNTCGTLMQLNTTTTITPTATTTTTTITATTINIIPTETVSKQTNRITITKATSVSLLPERAQRIPSMIQQLSIPSNTEGDKDEEIVKESWVMKKRQTGMKTKWDRRFMRLTNKRVMWWKEKKTKIPSQSPQSTTEKKKKRKGSFRGTTTFSENDDDEGASFILISEIEVYKGIIPFINHTNNRYGFVISTGSKSIKFETNTLLECQEWVICLNEVVLDAQNTEE